MNLDGADFKVSGVPEAEREIERLSQKIARYKELLDELSRKEEALGRKLASGQISPGRANAEMKRLSASRSRFTTWRDSHTPELSRQQSVIDAWRNAVKERDDEIETLTQQLIKANAGSIDKTSARAVALGMPPAMRRSMRETLTPITPNITPDMAGDFGSFNRDLIARSAAQAAGDLSRLDSGSVAGTAKNHDQRLANLIRQRSYIKGDPTTNVKMIAIDAGIAEQQRYVAQAEHMKKIASITTGTNEIYGKRLPEYDAALGGLKEGRPGYTAAKVNRESLKLDVAARKMNRNVKGAFGSDVADSLKMIIDGEQAGRDVERDSLLKVDRARTGVNKAEGLVTDAGRYRHQAGVLRDGGFVVAADQLERAAESKFKALSKLLASVKADVYNLPSGSEFEEARTKIGHSFGNAVMANHGGDTWMQERSDEKTALKTQAGRDKIVGKFDDKFAHIEDLKVRYNSYKSGGKTEEMQATGKQIYKESLELTKLTEALHAVERALMDEGKAIDSDKVRDKILMGGGIGDQNIKNFKPLNMPDGKLGEWVAKGLREIPGIGAPLHGVFGSPLANAINGSKAGQYVTGAARGLAGGDVATASAAAGGAEGAGAGAGAAVAGFASTGIGAIVIGIGAIIGSSFALAANSMERNAAARGEEGKAYDTGTKLGSKNRLVEDFRDPTNRSLNPRLAAMRYGGADYLDMAASINAPYLNKGQRQAATLTGLQLKRSYGLENGDVGALSSSLAVDRTVGAGGASLDQNMTRFAQVLETAVRNGISSEEVSQAFSKNLSQTKEQAGGVLSQNQRDGAMGQLIAAMQTGNPLLRGANGADKIQSMNNALAGFQGKDTAYLASALSDKNGKALSAKALGYSGGQAKIVDDALKDNRSTAMRYVANNQTPEVRKLLATQMIRTNGDNTTAMEHALSSMGLNSVSDSLPAAQEITRQLKKGVRPEDVRESHLDAFTGRYDPKKLSKDPLKENQSDNALGQVPQRQELNAQEIKITSSRVTFESKLDQANIQSVQSVYLSGISAVTTGNDKVAVNGLKPEPGHAQARAANAPPTPGAGGLLPSKAGARTLPARDVGGSDSAGIGQVAGLYHGGEIVMNPAASKAYGGDLARMNLGGQPGSKDDSLQILSAILRELKSQNRSVILGGPAAAPISASASAPSLLSRLVQGGGSVIQAAGGAVGGVLSRIGNAIAHVVGIDGGSASMPAFTGNKGQFIQAIVGQESGGNYGAVNARTGAMGKYQVMPQNILGWGKNSGRAGLGWDYEALGHDITPQQYLSSPKIQDQIAQFKLGQAYDKYGAAGAARAWYSGRPDASSRRPAANEPSPDEYAFQVLKRAGATSSGRAGAATQHGTQTVKLVLSGDLKVAGNPHPALTQAAGHAAAAQLRKQGLRVQLAPAQSARPGG